MDRDDISTDLIISQLDELGELGNLSYEQHKAGLASPTTTRERCQHVRSNRWLTGGILTLFLVGATVLALALIVEWTPPSFLMGFTGGGLLITPVFLWRFHRLSQIEALYDVLHTAHSESASTPSTPAPTHPA